MVRLKIRNRRLSNTGDADLYDLKYTATISNI